MTNNRATALLICVLGLTLIAHITVIAAPGFYSHDEWQRFDLIQSEGFWQYVKDLGVLRAGPEFGYPVRPIGFIEQGIASLWMRSMPAVSHLFSVVLHALAVWLFVLVLLRGHASRLTAALAGALFAVSPLSTLATGWIAASFDQLFIIFALLIALAIVPLCNEALSVRTGCIVVLGASGALLSKETAVLLPIAIIVFPLASCRATDTETRTRFFRAALLSLLPICVYLGIRAPAIWNTLHGHGVREYTLSFIFLVRNAFNYFAFPFVAQAEQVEVLVLYPQWIVWIGAIVHAAIPIAIAWQFGWRFAVLYFIGYFLFLLPMLLIPNISAHYLYGPGLTTAFALAALTVRFMTLSTRIAISFAVAAIVALFAHALWMQLAIYRTATCQTAFLGSLDELLPTLPPEYDHFSVVSDPGIPTYIARRAVFGRARYMNIHGQQVIQFNDDDGRSAGEPSPAFATRLRMTSSCELVR